MKLVIFDCDGTMVDSQTGIVSAMRQAFEDVGLTPPPRRAVLDIVGLSLPEAIAVLAPGQEPDRRGALVERFRAAFAHCAGQDDYREPLFPGARNAIEALAGRDDMVLGVATGKSMRGVKRIFAREDLGAHFATIQTADHHPSKPHPAMIETAMKEVGAQPGQTVMVGDTTYDIEMAVNAGVAALGVAWGYHPVDWLREAGALNIADSFEDVGAAIGRMLGPK